MAIDITNELNYIKSATYGEQVRGSIHDGILKIANEVEASGSVIVRNALTTNVYSIDPSTIYNVGDYVMFPDSETGALYVCQTSTTGGPLNEFNTNHEWLSVGLANEITDRVEYNNYRFDSDNGPNILAGKSCNDLLKASVWFVNKIDGVTTLTDFPIDGPGWIRVTVTNNNRVMQEVYPSNIDDVPYRLFRTKNARNPDGTSGVAWTDWYKIPLISIDDIDMKDIGNLLQSIFIRKNVVLDIGRYIGTVGSHIGANTSSGWNMCDIEAEHGKTYRITVRTIGSESSQPYIFLCDANDIILSIVTAQTTTIDHITKIVSPADTVSKIYITGYNTNSSSSDTIIKVEEPGMSSATVNGTSLVMN